MGSVAKWLAYLHPDTAALGSIPLLPEMFSEEKIIDVAEVNQKHCIENGGQWIKHI